MYSQYLRLFRDSFFCPSAASVARATVLRAVQSRFVVFSLLAKQLEVLFRNPVEGNGYLFRGMLYFWCIRKTNVLLRQTGSIYIIMSGKKTASTGTITVDFFIKKTNLHRLNVRTKWTWNFCEVSRMLLCCTNFDVVCGKRLYWPILCSSIKFANVQKKADYEDIHRWQQMTLLKNIKLFMHALYCVWY